MKIGLIFLTSMTATSASFAASMSAINPTAALEPSTASLLLAGAIALGFARRRADKH